MIEVSVANEADGTAWDAYLQGKEVNHHAYAWAWRSIIAETFGHKPFYCVAWDVSGIDRQETNGKNQRQSVAGVLPLFYVNSLIFGKALISIPYLNAGGIIADSEEAFQLLLRKASLLAEELGAAYIELRHRGPAVWSGHKLDERTHKVSMLLELNTNAEELFSSFVPKLRSQIRRPAKSGIYAQVSPATGNGDDSISKFYSVFSEHMRDLGTPVYPKKLFCSTKKHFGQACRVITVWHERKPIAVGITLGFGSSVEIPWASALRKYNNYSPNMMLYWEAIKTACSDGYRVFDFGRSSRDSSTYRFKEQWGARPLELHWYYKVLAGEVPDVNPKSPKFSLLVNCWKHLPLGLANRIGPWITRGLP
jgi:serine/alanine adding enzyme